MNLELFFCRVPGAYRWLDFQHLPLGRGKIFALLLRLLGCFSLQFIYKHTQADVFIYIYVHKYKGPLLFLGGNGQLDLGKLDANLSPTVIARGGRQSGLLRGQGHSTPL